MTPFVNVSNMHGGLFLSNKDNIANYYIKNNRRSIILKEDTNRGHNDKPIAKLLIVDDEPEILQVLQIGLEQNGFLVDGFTNPEEALQSFKSNAEDFRLMLSDIRMPGLSGIQLAKKVKELNSDIKVVLMTAFEIYEGDPYKVLFPSAHVDGFVQKPIGIDDLTNKILSIIGETKTGRED
jgi:two-component system cell cycle sensor histidine kinase/response regulator CckA